MNVKKLVILNIVVLVVLVLGGFAGFYYYNESVNYIKTDYAKVDGQQLVIAAPASGVLTKFDGKVGAQFQKDKVIGKLAVPGEDEPVSIQMPQSGTIVQTNAVENSFVAAGTPLAYAYDFDHLWITANIKETTIGDVKVGQDVDIYIDGYSESKLSGKVEQIGKATASVFSLLPSENADANYTKVTQVIPVKISIADAKGLGIMPGMNAKVRIHK
ncbi:MAG: hypothetical protein C6W58_02380 [Bacillaceae bacterium]|mgnify:CR=1 FL=1|uniref:HlyD family secretion protein n=1 Tax=Aeribacillus TaxID=1055323 RepID=UPI000E3B33AB|nr:HlyD family efflux transporter periplasmic adaptor subunit [Aeribacillus pallidus]REJ20560.1 MAG: hypothetical protein C6W58_02380 [Bacillaceae bacterium]